MRKLLIILSLFITTSVFGQWSAYESSALADSFTVVRDTTEALRTSINGIVTGTDFLPSSGGTMSGDIAMGLNQISFTDGHFIESRYDGTRGLAIYADDVSSDQELYFYASLGIYFTGDFLPLTTSTYDLGSATKTIQNIYTDDVTLSGVDINDVMVDSIQAQTQTRNFVIGFPQSGAAKVPLQIGNVTLTDVKGVIVGGTSVKFTMFYGPDVSLTGTEIFDDYVTCTSTTTAQDLSGTLVTGPINIDTDEYLWLDVNTVTGTVEVLTITVKAIGRD